MKIKSILSLLAVTLFAGVTIPAFGQSYSASPTPPPGYIPKYVSQTDQYGHYEGTSPYQYLSFWGATRGPQLSSTNDLLSLVKTIGLVQSNTTGVLQVTTATAVGTVTVTGSATVVVTGVALSGTALTTGTVTLNVPVSTGAPTVWAPQIVTALTSSTAISTYFAASGTGANIVLTALLPAANDSSLNISLATGSATGITTEATSAATIAGVAPGVSLPTPLNLNGGALTTGTITLSSGTNAYPITTATNTVALSGTSVGSLAITIGTNTYHIPYK